MKTKIYLKLQFSLIGLSFTGPSFLKDIAGQNTRANRKVFIASFCLFQVKNNLKTSLKKMVESGVLKHPKASNMRFLLGDKAKKGKKKPAAQSTDESASEDQEEEVKKPKKTTKMKKKAVVAAAAGKTRTLIKCPFVFFAKSHFIFSTIL